MLAPAAISSPKDKLNAFPKTTPSRHDEETSVGQPIVAKAAF